MVEHVKQFLRIDGSEDDMLLTSLIAAAKEYVKNATGLTVDEENELQILAVTMLVTHWYENREPLGQANMLEFSLNSIFLQLSYCYPPPPDPVDI
ncbi:head-tail connector protein [Fictibacillus aquaticus]|uniref:head-tail connector protein n=1 Tax=Fictibacillus aquaticus TaxID=2021314 RepID=UPI0026BAD2C8